MPETPTMPRSARIAAYRDLLVPWYRENARDLPWRRSSDPWGVWVSEIMLQQTRVETVRPYWDRFLRRFPDPAALAAASEEEVLEAWSGLGYYRRARSLREGARLVVEKHAGTFPADERDALEIPGIGRYTAGAIRSIALGRRAPILDGNVTRVLARVFGLRGDVSKAPVSKILWAVAERVVEAGEPGEVNQAQMELGALVCLPRDPKCEECPLASRCVARREGTQTELPELPAKRPTVGVTRTVLLVRRGGEVLLRRRLASELLPGLWDFPGAFGGNDGDRSAGLEEARALLPFAVEAGESLGTLRHAVTYRRIELEVRAATPVAGDRAGAGGSGPAPKGSDGADLAWRRPDEALVAAISSPARRILKRWG